MPAFSGIVGKSDPPQARDGIEIDSYHFFVLHLEHPRKKAPGERRPGTFGQTGGVKAQSPQGPPGPETGPEYSSARARRRPLPAGTIRRPAARTERPDSLAPAATQRTHRDSGTGRKISPSLPPTPAGRGNGKGAGEKPTEAQKADRGKAAGFQPPPGPAGPETQAGGAKSPTRRLRRAAPRAGGIGAGAQEGAARGAPRRQQTPEGEPGAKRTPARPRGLKPPGAATEPAPGGNAPAEGQARTGGPEHSPTPSTKTACGGLGGPPGPPGAAPPEGPRRAPECG